jgi:fatty acid desaturase
VLSRYESSPYFLLNYQILSFFAYLGILIFLYFFHPFDFAPSPMPWFLALTPLLFNSIIGLIFVAVAAVALFANYYENLPTAILFTLPIAGIYFGMLAVQLIHLAAHQNFRPRWLNRVVGEILSIHLLSGFPSFVVLHLLHHQNPDDPELDPHPNGDLSFLAYFLSIKGKLRSHFAKRFFLLWGESPRTRFIWNLGQILLPLHRVMRAAILLAVGGPVGFTLFFLPSFIANHLTFAHINYFTHERQEDGSVRIVNLNHNWLYRGLNILMLGGYLHRNHHEAPWLWHPGHYVEKKESA